jgi:hypothetical protein
MQQDLLKLKGNFGQGSSPYEEIYRFKKSERIFIMGDWVYLKL